MEYDYDDVGRIARSVVRKENDSDTGDGEIKNYVYTYANDNLLGEGNYDTKGQSDYSKIRKWGIKGCE